MNMSRRILLWSRWLIVSSQLLGSKAFRIITRISRTLIILSRRSIQPRHATLTKTSIIIIIIIIRIIIRIITILIIIVIKKVIMWTTWATRTNRNNSNNNKCVTTIWCRKDKRTCLGCWLTTQVRRRGSVCRTRLNSYLSMSTSNSRAIRAIRK